MLIYKTIRKKGYGKQNYYWNEYRLENSKINKYKCHKQKFFDGRENSWDYDEHIIETWDIGDPHMPDWLRGKIK